MSIGNLKLSVDIFKYATVMAPEAVCQNIEVALDENGEATISAEDVDGGSFDPEGGPVELSIDKTDFTCADLGENSVILTVTDDEGAPAACTAVVTVVDKIPPVISCNTHDYCGSGRLSLRAAILWRLFAFVFN